MVDGVEVGDVLAASNGAWTGVGLTYARQWLRAGVAIPGATGAAYTLITDDVGPMIGLSVTSTTSEGGVAYSPDGPMLPQGGLLT